MKNLLFTSILCTSFVFVFPQSPYWNDLEAEGTAEERHENAFVQAGDRFFLIGGRGQKPVDIFNTEERSWSPGAQPPVEIHHMQAVNLDGLIYVIAGFTGGWPYETPLTHVFIYDPVEDLWATGPEIPENRRRGAAGAVVHNNKIYLLNGIINGHSSGWVNWLDEFDPYTNSWKKLPDSPRERDHFHAAVINNKIYAAGGRRSGSVEGDGFAGTVKETDVYDLTTQTWETFAEIPTPRAGSATTVFNEKLVVLGGESNAQEAAHDEVEAFDPETQSWENLPPMQNGRHGTQAISLNNQIIIGAGSGNRGGGPELDHFEVLTTEQEISFETDPIVKGTLSASTRELNFAENTNTGEVEITNTDGNQALLIQYIQIDHSEAFEITNSVDTPFIIAPGGKITVEIIKKTANPDTNANLYIKTLGGAAPVEINLN